MTINKEVLYPITKKIALQCLALSSEGNQFADVAKPSGVAYVPSVPVRVDRLSVMLEAANGAICICSDEKLPGYRIAFYDVKRDQWVRLKTDQAKVAGYIERVAYGKAVPA